MEKDLERLKSIEKKIDLLLKKKGKDRFELLDAFAEAFLITVVSSGRRWILQSERRMRCSSSK